MDNPIDRPSREGKKEKGRDDVEGMSKEERELGRYCSGSRLEEERGHEEKNRGAIGMIFISKQTRGKRKGHDDGKKKRPNMRRVEGDTSP